jgi:alpha-glucosidase
MKTFAAVLFHVVAASAQVRIFNSADIFRAAPDGIEIRSGAGVVRISALRDDVLRVRLGPNGTLPEDASWAVLSAARTARVSITPLSDGFSTAKLRVHVDKICA